MIAKIILKICIAISGLLYCADTNAQNIYRISNEQLQVSVSGLGAELSSIKASGREYLWQGNPFFWHNRAPLMFPVNVRFRGDSLTYNGKTYTMPFMGLVNKMEFEVMKSSGSDRLILKAEPTDSMLRNHYPFPFSLTVEYRLHKNKLKVVFTLKNTGDSTLYYALGAHPGFVIQLDDTWKRSDYAIQFSEKPVTLIRNRVKLGLLLHDKDTFLLHGKSMLLSDKRIGSTGHFFGQHGLKTISLGYKDRKPFISMDTGNFSNLNLWTPPGYPFVCFEPMVSHHDFIDSPSDIVRKTHLISLKSGKESRYYFTIQIFNQ